MSLLDNPPHAVSVQARTVTRGPHGTTYEPSGEPVTVPCIVRSVSATESNVDGLTAQTLRRIVSRAWAGDIHSLVTIGPDLFEPQGDPQRFDGSSATAHWEILLQRVGTVADG